MSKPKARSKKAQIARLQARLEVLTGKGTEQMRASLQAQIDELAGPLAPGGLVDPATAPKVSESGTS